MAGAKLWHLAPPHVPKPALRSCKGRGRVDWVQAASDGVRHCAVLPGETMVVPSMWWHATCNLQPYTVAMGGQVRARPSHCRAEGFSCTALATHYDWPSLTPRRARTTRSHLAAAAPLPDALAPSRAAR